MNSGIVKKLTRLVIVTLPNERKNSTLMLNMADSRELATYLHEHMIQPMSEAGMCFDMILATFLEEKQYLRFKTFRGMAIEWDTDAGASCVFVSERV